MLSQVEFLIKTVNNGYGIDVWHHFWDALSKVLNIYTQKLLFISGVSIVENV